MVYWCWSRARDECTPSSPFLGVNTSPMRYDFHFCRRKSHPVLCKHGLIHLLVITGLICGMLTHQYLAVGDEQEATQRNAGVKELHEEIFCDVVRTAFCLQLLKRLCQDSVLKSLLSVFPHTQNTPVELWSILISNKFHQGTLTIILCLVIFAGIPIKL